MFYAHDAFDRADHLRKQPEVLSDFLNNTDSQAVPVWRNRSLVGDRNGQTRCLTLPITVFKNINSQDKIFLGLHATKAYFSVALSALDEDQLEQTLTAAKKANPEADNIRFEDLRAIGPRISDDEGTILAYARGLCYWHDTVRFCAACSGKLSSIHGGHIKKCETENCRYQSFPRTDPAVIMLVTYPASESQPEQCLLGRNKAWPQGVYSTLAGFVETGESLEQAVKREVFEESAIRIHKVEYIASQPWPFPRSIMLGFQSEALNTEIVCDPEELDDARWFSRSEIKTFGTWGEESDNFKLPRTDSIARMLINRWMESGR